MRVYYAVTQSPDEVPVTLIIHDLHMSSRIKPSAFEPFKPSDCMWLVPGTEDQDPLSASLAGLNWRSIQMTSQASTENWLQQYVSDAVSHRLCTRIGCTTCGAHEFRSGLSARIAGSARSVGVIQLPSRAEGVEHLLDLLSGLRPPKFASFEWDEALRLLIYDCWGRLGGDSALPHMQDPLGQSWAGHVLERMIAHESASRRASQEHEARSVKAQEERMRRKRERQLRHERRLLQKRERDQLWWANAASRIRSEI
jgi:hypothetical protein